MPEYRWEISRAFEGKRVRQAALQGLGMSNGQLKRAKFEGSITLDGESVRADQLVHEGQTLCLFVPEVRNVQPQDWDLPLTVCYQDESLMIVDKPAPLPSASSCRQSAPTLENAVYHHLGCPGEFVYRPVNRLDKGTSGLMLVALNAHAQHLAQQALHTDDFIREYLAVVEGCPPQLQGVIDLPMGKVDSASIRREVRADGKPARTFYRVLKAGERRSLVRLRLDTGRTHQIRVHMQAMGCPVAGDFLYGTELEALPGRFALHSAHVKIRHPLTGRWLEYESSMPPELRALLD